MMLLNLLNLLTRASSYGSVLGVGGGGEFVWRIFSLNKLQDAVVWAEAAPLVTEKLLPFHKAFA